MSVTAPVHVLVARKACRCVVASTAEDPSIAPAIKRDIAAWERMGLTVERVPRREIHRLPWATLGDGWCLHDPPRPKYVAGTPGPNAQRNSVAYEGRRAGRHQPTSAVRSDAR